MRRKELRCVKLKSPVTYQGGKTRLARTVVDHMDILPPFYDFCCGSGAIALEVRKRYLAPTWIYMVDRSPWGKFWSLIGKRKFSILRFQEYISGIPENPAEIKPYLENIIDTEVPTNEVPYAFLILQAGTFGGKALDRINGRWTCQGSRPSFRDWWKPTPTSSRRYPVNPMMPMPTEILKRVRAIANNMVGVHGYCEDVRSFKTDISGTAYVDPPYIMRAGYGQSFDVKAFASSLPIPCYVSESRPLTNEAVCLARPRSKGGISGRRKEGHQEWLSLFRNGNRAVTTLVGLANEA